MPEAELAPLRLHWVPVPNGGIGYAYGTRVDSAADSPPPPPPLAANQEHYDTPALDLLALHFTAVKLLYMMGDLPRVAALVAALETTRLVSDVSLHTTTIRNEQAYYTCIAQLLCLKEEWPLVPSPKGEGPPIYICGDSHTLPLSWNCIQAGGRKTMLVPALVTGLKHWHLREASDFYPKENFKCVTDQLPVGATVIFVFGEIDCREGILLAVERGRYKTAEEGMDATIAHFIRAVTALAARKRLRAFIHPICPVLDVTRGVVMAYNARYQRAIEAARPPPGADWSLQWLDMFDAMLDQSGSSAPQLKAELQLDGTHMSPVPLYLPLLEKALAAAAAAATAARR